jgi:hypothetical protein
MAADALAAPILAHAQQIASRLEAVAGAQQVTLEEVRRLKAHTQGNMQTLPRLPGVCSALAPG